MGGKFSINFKASFLTVMYDGFSLTGRLRQKLSWKTPGRVYFIRNEAISKSRFGKFKKTRGR